MAYPGHIRRGTGCGKCANRGVEMYLEWLSENRPDLTMVGDYSTKDTPTLHRCSQGHEWMAYPGHIKKGHGCDTCNRDSKGHLPAGYWTLERCMEDAQKYPTRMGWKRGSGGAYGVARTKGWLEQCTAHMEKLCRDPWTDEELITDAQKYPTRVDWQRESGSAYVTSAKRGTQFHERACAHMEPASWSDYDAVYVYEIGDALGWTGLHKTGLTSWKLGDERIKNTNRANGTDYRIVALIRTTKGDAPKIEKAILDSGEPFTDLPDTFVDGRTEVRRFGPRAIETINQLAIMSGYKEAA